MNVPGQFPNDMLEFIQSHHVFSLSACENGQPWSATCYYAFDPDDLRLIFVSDIKTKHASMILQNNKVSGTISTNETNIAEIQGIQFMGIAEISEGDKFKRFRKLFLVKFPLAFFKKLTLWSVRLDYVKMTDNSKYFACKTHWNRNI